LDTIKGALFGLDVTYALGGGADAAWELSLCFAFLAAACDCGGDEGTVFFAFVRTIRGGSLAKRCSNLRKPTNKNDMHCKYTSKDSRNVNFEKSGDALWHKYSFLPLFLNSFGGAGNGKGDLIGLPLLVSLL
jgi:hypothetical protein